MKVFNYLNCQFKIISTPHHFKCLLCSPSISKLLKDRCRKDFIKNEVLPTFPLCTIFKRYFAYTVNKILQQLHSPLLTLAPAWKSMLAGSSQLVQRLQHIVILNNAETNSTKQCKCSVKHQQYNCSLWIASAI